MPEANPGEIWRLESWSKARILLFWKRFQVMKKEKVVVAMSGGVDSSVAAALLLDRGYEVIGVTMNLFSLPPELCRSDGLRSCCGWRSIEDANEVASKLGIPHLVVDFRPAFEKSVIRDFCAEYGRGRTPNPCIRCNQSIKFGLLLKRAARLGASWVATGHHSRIVRGRGRPLYHLKKGKDRAKDQSYFLYTLTQDQLARLLMPVGELTKEEVREEARKRNLRVASKPESQEVCFVPRGGYPEFLGQRIPDAFKPGPIVDLDGRVLGEHRGIAHFTVGQRRGLRLSSPRPLYVVSIDPANQAVIVGPDEALWRSQFVAGEVNWVSGERLEKRIETRARIRYKHEEARATVDPFRPDKVLVTFSRPQRAVTPGQSVVFYQGDEVLGGGIIDQVVS